jgi:hypothetical protein
MFDMFMDLADFVSTNIPALIAGMEKLSVLFVTYNEVNGYESGLVDTKKDRLTIQVQSGNLHYSPLTTSLVWAIGTPLAEIGSAAMDDEAREAQEAVEASIKIEVQEDTAFVAVVYAGLSAFDEALLFGRKIRQDNPAAKVVIVTCDCDPGRKRRVLVPMLETGELAAVIETYECGGREAMRKILLGFIEAWPSTVPA